MIRRLLRLMIMSRDVGGSSRIGRHLVKEVPAGRYAAAGEEKKA